MQMRQKELFIVEGRSANSTLSKVIDKANQQVHALQGKLLNVSKHSCKAVLADLECQQLIHVLGCGFGESLDVSALPFSNVLIVMDPDIDGAHSGALLLSFISQHYQPLVESGRLSLIKLPLFRVSAGNGALSYAWSDAELNEILTSYKNAFPGTEHQPSITRYKGVAQYAPEECVRFIVNPNSRRQFVLK